MQERYFVDEMDGRRWGLVLDLISPAADRLVVATGHVRAPLFGRAAPVPRSLEQIAGSLLERRTSRERWHHRQLCRTDYYAFRLDASVWRYVRVPRELHDWGPWEGYPEDPCFYRGELPLVETISHEGYCYVFLDRQGARRFRDAGLGLWS
ncbi:MAG: hypothetical protein JXA20_11765 [Spirochaetes bacterium]|nr:hypothetical protein [Spirochaetota bacterium]